jgi:5-methylcytosine-specific restriction protein A
MRLTRLSPSVALLGSKVATAKSLDWQSDRRASRHERGYGSEWDKKRAAVLEAARGLCQCEECRGGQLRVRAASQVDHKVSKAEWLLLHGSLHGVDDDANLQAINTVCHRKKTDADRARVHALRIGRVRA